MAQHFRNAASQISRIIRCPGSTDFVQYLVTKKVIPKEETTSDASEGTMLHEQQDLHLHNKPFTKELTAEQEDCINTNTEWLHRLMETHGISSFETEVQRNCDGFGLPETGGTCDVSAEGNINGIRSLHVVDWKFGRGVFVDVTKNEQTMTYLLTLIGDESRMDNYDEFWIHIGQPRLDNMASYQCSKDDLYGLINAIKNALKSHNINPGNKQCLWCRGKINCAEYNSFVNEAAASLFSVEKAMEANQIDFTEMSRILKLEPIFKKAFKAIKDHMAILSAPDLAKLNLKRVAGRSVRAFANKDNVIRYLVEEYEADDIYDEPSLKSPAQLEKSIPALKRDKKFQAMIFKPLGSPTIVDISDKRPDFDAIGAAEVFGHLK